MALGTLALWFTGGVVFRGQSRTSAEGSDVFSPAHVSVGQAVGHFFGLRPDPQQPIAFVHSKHVNEVQMECVDCHVAVERGPMAGIPDIRTCWSCHVNTLTDHPEIQKVRAYQDRGEDIPWQRVYGWLDEDHVHFNHAPHIRASVECQTCHGDVTKMGIAERAVDHTMGFCVGCHKERKAPLDCTTCHY